MYWKYSLHNILNAIGFFLLLHVSGLSYQMYLPDCHSVDSNKMSLPSSSYINTGSIPEQDGDRIYNTCTVYGPNGDLLTTYRKVYNIVVYSVVHKV